MRISDWSSDVCSSDLQVGCGFAAQKMLVGRKESTPWVSGDCAVHHNALNVEPHLTFREHQILELVAVGCSAKQIALEIHIAPPTVERHIANVLLKLNARNRAPQTGREPWRDNGCQDV